nr:hypothetical protein [Tanacetum cinerariifolium]
MVVLLPFIVNLYHDGELLVPLEGLIQAVADWLPNAEHNSVPGTFMLISRRGGVAFENKDSITSSVRRQMEFNKKIQRDVSEGKYDALKGLIQAVADWLPNAEHNSVPGTFMLISRRGGVEEIKMLDEKAHEWLLERNPNSCCRAYFDMDRCGATFENGILESFNPRIL